MCKVYTNQDNEKITLYKGHAIFGNTMDELRAKMRKIDEHENRFNIYKDCVYEMLKDGESGLYIKIYINDLLRSKDITIEEAQQLHFIMIDALGGNGFATLSKLGE